MVQDEIVDYLRKLAADIEAGKYGEIIRLIPIVHYRDKDGNEHIGTLNHSGKTFDRIFVVGLLVFAIKGLMSLLR